MLKIFELKAGFRRERLVIHDFSLEVKPKQRLWIKCPHFGVGQLLMALLMGQLKPFDGEIRIMGKRPYLLATSSIPYLMRNLGLFWPDIPLSHRDTARENLFWRLAASGEGRHRSLVESALSLFGLSNIADLDVRRLSRAERVKLALARAIISRPPLVLALEPVRDLPAPEARRVLRILAHMTLLGSAVVIISSEDPPDVPSFELIEIREQ